MSRIAIVSAMHQELRALLPALDKHQSATFAGCPSIVPMWKGSRWS